MIISDNFSSFERLISKKNDNPFHSIYIYIYKEKFGCKGSKGSSGVHLEETEAGGREGDFVTLSRVRLSNRSAKWLKVIRSATSVGRMRYHFRSQRGKFRIADL